MISNTPDIAVIDELDEDLDLHATPAIAINKEINTNFTKLTNYQTSNHQEGTTTADPEARDADSIISKTNELSSGKQKDRLSTIESHKRTYESIVANDKNDNLE